jgi:hypothetical protein
LAHQGVPSEHGAAQEAEGHQALGLALVLKDQVHLRWSAAAGDREEQIGRAPTQLFSHQRCVRRAKLREIQPLSRPVGEEDLQKAARVLYVSEDQSEEAIVGVV